MSPAIDDVALRDVEPWKDRLEVRLDNRQVFFLFFGSAMVACLLFVLGVIVGKKLETRTRAESPAIEDPLAILDRLGSQGPMPVEQAVTFPKALTTSATPAPRGHAPTSARVAAALHEAPREAAPRAEAREVAAPPIAHAKPVAAESPSPRLAAPAPKAGATSGVASSTVAPSAPRIISPTASAPSANRPAAPVIPSPSPSPRAVANAPSVAAGPAPVAAPVSPPVVGGKGRFTLQLSAFQEKSEAEAMVRKLGAGHASVVPTEIPGKGTWYRVRAGSFATFQEASTAKTTFEREHNIIAYVASSTGSTKP